MSARTGDPARLQKIAHQLHVERDTLEIYEALVLCGARDKNGQQRCAEPLLQLKASKEATEPRPTMQIYMSLAMKLLGDGQWSIVKGAVDRAGRLSSDRPHPEGTAQVRRAARTVRGRRTTLNTVDGGKTVTHSNPAQYQHQTITPPMFPLSGPCPRCHKPARLDSSIIDDFAAQFA